MGKKAALYTKAPEPAKGPSSRWLLCTVCGARGQYNMVDIFSHSSWCHLFKEKAKQAEAKKKRRQNVAASRR